MTDEEDLIEAPEPQATEPEPPDPEVDPDPEDPAYNADPEDHDGEHDHPEAS